MNYYLKMWSRMRLIRPMNEVKQIFVEKKNKLENDQETEDFMRAHKQGAIMMAVINGKFSGESFYKLPPLNC